MPIAQVLLDSATEYEKKCGRIDRAVLATGREVATIEIASDAPASRLADLLRERGATAAHIYGPRRLPASLFVRFPIPYVASAEVSARRFAIRRPVPPARIVTPIARTGPAEDSRVVTLPEAVEEEYLGNEKRRHSHHSGERRRVGSFGPDRGGVRNMIDQTVVRLQRFREDVDWHSFDSVPTPEDLASFDLWVDPATDELDFDGFVAEALAVGLPVVASRTPINAQRLEKGRTGFLVPPGDPNELVHSVLTALFKPEASAAKTDAASQTISKFRPYQRLRALARIYEALN
ncbi:MAG TPA: glycosyltransferase [Thermoanaerobaculia bacterium]|nr:glycosyltransferase [Thermoanaerobaculia bacterium]